MIFQVKWLEKIMNLNRTKSRPLLSLLGRNPGKSHPIIPPTRLELATRFAPGEGPWRHVVYGIYHYQFSERQQYLSIVFVVGCDQGWLA
jgi:hypothetical protein